MKIPIPRTAIAALTLSAAGLKLIDRELSK